MTQTSTKNKKPSQPKTQTGILVSVSSQRLVRQLLADDRVRIDLTSAGERCSQSGLYARALAVYADKIATDHVVVAALDPAALANQIATLSAALALALDAQGSSGKPGEMAKTSASGQELGEIEQDSRYDMLENAAETQVSSTISAPVHGGLVPGPKIANPFASAMAKEPEIEPDISRNI